MKFRKADGSVLNNDFDVALSHSHRRAALLEADDVVHYRALAPELEGTISTLR